MASEKDFKQDDPALVGETTSRVVDDPGKQVVPLGGQPIHGVITYEETVANTKAEHEACVAVWDKVIKALQKALEECPSGKSKGAHEIRNHCQVWLVQVQDVQSKL